MGKGEAIGPGAAIGPGEVGKGVVIGPGGAIGPGEKWVKGTWGSHWTRGSE